MLLSFSDIPTVQCFTCVQKIHLKYLQFVYPTTLICDQSPDASFTLPGVSVLTPVLMINKSEGVSPFTPGDLNDACSLSMGNNPCAKISERFHDGN
ncbi:hypothetical protein Y032_0065g3617 [Ancylostoma ceylanicum]|uniref:Uncharacterized protein n=1 Tax=Ancylostoma ceylanicum TaxID=53326 RepID=A0A016TZW0_9BILA|nr:hypothetical protein Y032_0065g3617 [Ancylostoma ceylanicum]